MDYKVGDKYVMLKIQHDEILTVLESEIDEPWFNTRIIRRATPQEIQCGHRLPSVEILRDCDILPCTIILER
ncbi:MAG: hypothetical protein RIQ74_1129 [Pseudomonadota bacterium]|jgi:hypothetical protein